MRTHKQRQKALVFHNTIVGELGFRTGVQFSSCVVNKPLDSADYIDKRRESWLTAVDFVRPVSTCIVSITDVRRVNTAISVGASHHVRPVARYTHGTYTPNWCRGIWRSNCIHPNLPRRWLAKRAYRCSVPAVCNSVPKTVVICHSVTVFKSRLKTFLFSWAFSLPSSVTSTLPGPSASEVTTLWRYANTTTTTTTTTTTI